jgi:hypothetical protein
MINEVYYVLKSGCLKATYISLLNKNDCIFGISIHGSSEKYNPDDYDFSEHEIFIETPEYRIKKRYEK